MDPRYPFEIRTRTRELGGWLGQACASIGAVLDPQLFVFGGGVAITVEETRALAEVSAMSVEDRLNARYDKFRKMGSVGIIEP